MQAFDGAKNAPQMLQALCMIMSANKFSCPICGEGVPKYKSAYMTNSTKIICRACGTKIRPDRKSLSLIGGIGGGIGSILAAPISIYTVISGNWLQGVMAFFALLVILIAVCCFFILKFTYFAEVPENA